VIDGPPPAVALAVDLHKHLVEVPSPMPNSPQARYTLSPHICNKHRPELVPPESNRLVTKVDFALKPEILHVAQRQRDARTS